MERFATSHLAQKPDTVAPDGSEVRLLCAMGGGSMAHFRLLPGAVSKAVAHRTVEEIWVVTAGIGRLWRRLSEVEEIIQLESGTSLTIPIGTAFQFRNDGATPLDIIGVTMPPWPGMDEAYVVAGPWPVSRQSGGEGAG
jgi:mannose-6-phosphate isomerase-like protein (cupin superfamily)